jgi:hypothetical protein
MFNKALFAKGRDVARPARASMEEKLNRSSASLPFLDIGEGSNRTRSCLN